MNTILTDDEIGELHRPYGENSINGFDHVKAFARAFEAAVLAKLAQQADRRRVPDEWRELLMEVVCLTDRPDLQVRASAMLAAAPEAPAQAEVQVQRCLNGVKVGQEVGVYAIAHGEARRFGAGERAAFEAWWKGDLLDWRGHQNTAALHAWEAWKARAAITKATGLHHITDGTPCWCEPEVNYVDPETGASVVVHKEPK